MKIDWVVYIVGTFDHKLIMYFLFSIHGCFPIPLLLNIRLIEKAPLLLLRFCGGWFTPIKCEQKVKSVASSASGQCTQHSLKNANVAPHVNLGVIICIHISTQATGSTLALKPREDSATKSWGTSGLKMGSYSP